jgi:hypothetical protein
MQQLVNRDLFSWNCPEALEIAGGKYHDQIMEWQFEGFDVSQELMNVHRHEESLGKVS